VNEFAVAKFPLKMFMAANALIIHLSRGRIGSQLGTPSILLPHSIGRKSGRHFINPIVYFFTDGFYFVIGSNYGKDQDTAWFYNLVAQPGTTIEVKGRNISVEASQALGTEPERLWKYASDHHPPYLH